jgi:hypothetical protein
MRRLETERKARVEAKIREAKIREVEVDEIVERFKALPTIGPMLTDDDLYDEWGLPK